VTKSWTKGVGFPVLTVEQHEAYGIIRLTQTRFLSAGNTTKSEDETPHPVFLNVLTTSGISKEVLDQRSGTIRVSLDFYKLNASQTGFYRVAYPPARLRKLGDDICKGILSVEDRIGLISDTAALAFAGHPNVRTSNLLGFLQHFEDESNFFVWKIIIDTLNEISKCLLFENKKIRDAFEHFRKHLVKKRLHSLGTFNKHDDLDEQRFKALMFGNSGGDEIAVKAAMEMFKRFVGGDGGPINANIRAEVFEIVLKRGGKKEVSTFLNNSAPYLRIG
jgi:aminopeptidase 2